jgi:hypothetical protein
MLKNKMPFNKPCRRCGNLMLNRTKYQEICEKCKSKKKVGRKSKKEIKGKRKNEKTKSKPKKLE